MSMAHVLSEVPAMPTRGSEFLTRAQRSARCRRLADEGWVVARVVPVFDDGDDDEPASGAGTRGGLVPGGLSEALEGAVEISLALRGALPPSVGLDAEPLAMARDQLFRVRALGATGLCLVLPELERLARASHRSRAQDNLLSASDSAALSVWRELAEHEPLVLLFDGRDRDVSMLAAQPLDEVFGALCETAMPPSWRDDARDATEPCSGSLWVASERAAPTQGPMEAPEDERATLPGWHPDEALAEWRASLRPAAPPPASSPSADTLDSSIADDSAESGISLSARPDGEQEVGTELTLETDAPPTVAPPTDAPPTVARPSARVIPHDPLEGLHGLDGDQPEAAEEQNGAIEPLQTSLFDAIAPPAPLLPPERCREHAAELLAARGPKPVRMIEELFRTRYTPLSEALARGLDDAQAERAVDGWCASFEKSYSDGFTTMRLTGKRPTMVLDAPDIAARIGRLNGARAVQLLLVDSLRYDLAQRVHGLLGERLAGRALCVEQTLLWSALPTITPAQLRLLARGPRALRDADPPSETPDPIVHREGSVTTLRRMRIGQRDLVKLDLVEARLREAGPGFDERLDAIAGEVVDVVARYAESLPARTLLFLFGDHGFVLPIDGPQATGPARQGGAAPEEVLVSGQAWLLGGTH